MPNKLLCLAASGALLATAPAGAEQWIELIKEEGASHQLDFASIHSSAGFSNFSWKIVYRPARRSGSMRVRSQVFRVTIDCTNMEGYFRESILQDIRGHEVSSGQFSWGEKPFKAEDVIKDLVKQHVCAKY